MQGRNAMGKWKRVIGAVVLGGSSMLLVTPAAAYDNWGQEVKACKADSCYPGGSSRGEYVHRQASDPEAPGYSWEIHALAHPGKAAPAPFK